MTEMEQRNKIHDCVSVIEKMPLITSCYVMGQGIASQAVWYINDEVGSIIGHSDKPNVRVRAFVNYPSNEVNDANRLEVSVMWPI